MTAELSLDLLKQVGPLLREIASDNVFENISELYADATRWGGGEEWEKGGLEGSAVRRGDRNLIRPGVGWIDKVGGVYTVLEVNHTSLTSSSVKECV